MVIGKDSESISDSKTLRVSDRSKTGKHREIVIVYVFPERDGNRLSVSNPSRSSNCNLCDKTADSFNVQNAIPSEMECVPGISSEQMSLHLIIPISNRFQITKNENIPGIVREHQFSIDFTSDFRRQFQSEIEYEET